MKILLLTSPWRQEDVSISFMKEKGGILKRAFARPEQTILGVFPPLGLLYIGAVLKESGHQVKVLDGYFLNIEEITSIIKQAGYEIIGISSYTAGWENDKKTISLLKERFPDKVIVAGGPHPTVWKEECLRECGALDVVVCGEGEYIMKGLVTTLDSRGPLENIPGIIWRRGGEIRINPSCLYVDDLDGLPFPDRSLVDLNRYIPTISVYKRLPSTTVIASRGCPYSCIFCHAIKRVRLRDPESVLNELEELISRYGIKDVTFYDEIFALSRKNALKICEGIIENKLDLTWAANARPQELDAELLRKMKRAGCWRLLFGVESGSQKVLDIMKKGIKIGEIEEAVRLTKKFGIEAHGTFIFGTPGETFHDGLKTIRFARRLGLDYAAFGSLAPLPGTEVYQMINDPGKNDFSRHTMFNISYVPETMTKGELEKLLTLSYRKFYFRVFYILRRILKIRSFEDLRRNIVGFFGLATLR